MAGPAGRLDAVLVCGGRWHDFDHARLQAAGDAGRPSPGPHHGLPGLRLPPRAGAGGSAGHLHLRCAAPPGAAGRAGTLRRAGRALARPARHQLGDRGARSRRTPDVLHPPAARAAGRGARQPVPGAPADRAVRGARDPARPSAGRRDRTVHRHRRAVRVRAARGAGGAAARRVHRAVPRLRGGRHGGAGRRAPSRPLSETARSRRGLLLHPRPLPGPVRHAGPRRGRHRARGPGALGDTGVPDGARAVSGAGGGRGASRSPNRRRPDVAWARVPAGAPGPGTHAWLSRAAARPRARRPPRRAGARTPGVRPRSRRSRRGRRRAPASPVRGPR